MNPAHRRWYEALRAHVEAQWEATLKQPNRVHRHPYIDPGSVYEGNLWDWDSYWASYALLTMVQAPDPRRAILLKHVRGNVENFLDFQLPDGYVPIMIQERDGDEPYLNARHREGRVMNMHKPFLAQHICLFSSQQGDWEWIRPRWPAVKAYLDHYRRVYLQERSGLYLWADDVMIGMDNDPATFGRPPFSTAGLFLNEFMLVELAAAAHLADQLGDAEAAGDYRRQRSRLAAAVEQECWDRRDGCYYSVDADIHTRAFDWFHQGLGVFWKTLPIKVRTWMTFLPLWTGHASPAQTESLVTTHLKDPNTFAAPFGVVSLSKDEKMYSLEATINPSNWLGPLWLVVQYLVFRGLLDAGRRREAEHLCLKTLELLGGDLDRTGTLHEFYHPDTGEPIMNGGFLNWNMLVLNMVRELEGESAPDESWRRPRDQ